MDFTAAALLLLAGLVAGFLAGVFGIGGGIVLVPALLVYLHFVGVSSLVATHVAMGTSLCVVAAVSAASAWEYRRQDQVVWRASGVIALSGIAGAALGSGIAAGCEGTTLRRVFGFMLLVASARLFSGKRKQPGDPGRTIPLPQLLAAGFVIGLVSSLSGIGGGEILAPVLVTLIHLPSKKGIGTAAAAIVPIAAAGAAGYLFWGWGNVFLPEGMQSFIDWRGAIPLVAGAVPGAIVGIRLSAGIDTETARKVYAVALLVIMLRMFFP